MKPEDVYESKFTSGKYVTAQQWRTEQKQLYYSARKKKKSKKKDNRILLMLA